MSVRHLIRKRFFPHLWCPGCGHGIILNGLLRAVNELGLDQCSLCMVSGIGCSSRISGYVDFHSMHTLHGRALAFATGLKLTRPGLNVFVPMGDGDATAIGGNHFIHACRRNIDMVAIVMNNRIYGMTGGQYSPLSGRGIVATTAPYSNIDRAFNTRTSSVALWRCFSGIATIPRPWGPRSWKKIPSSSPEASLWTRTRPNTATNTPTSSRGQTRSNTMEKYRFLLSGSGGQGVITMAILLAGAAVLYEKRIAVQSQSYGPEARGGATRSDVIISDSEILFPKVTQPNVLVALTNEAAGKYMPLLRPGGLCLYDSDLVQPSQRLDADLKGLPMYRKVMEKVGKANTLNICVLGALITLTGAIRMESIQKMLADRFRPAFHAANNAALELGAELARPLV